MINIKKALTATLRWALSLPINSGVDKGPQPLMFNPALTTCASERMKNQRFSFFAFGADRAIGASTG